MQKTRKALTKRFKITRTGKVIYRFAGQNHFRAKKSGKIKRQKRQSGVLSKELARQIKKLMS